MAKKLLRNVGIFGLAIGSLFLSVGLGVMGVAIKRGLKQQETSRWPTVQGEIVSTALTKSDHRSADSPLIYEYELDGHVYKSTRVVHIDRANIHYNDWVQLANGLPQTGSVTVYYNPSDPIESVIVAGDSKVSWNGLEFGAIFGGFAAFWMTAWWGMTHWLPNQLGRANRLSRKTKVQSGSEQAVPFDGHKPSNSAPSSDTTAPAEAHQTLAKEI